MLVLFSDNLRRGFLRRSHRPGVCSLVAAPGAPSVAAPARVEHLVGKVKDDSDSSQEVGHGVGKEDAKDLVGKVLSASSKGRSPGC